MIDIKFEINKRVSERMTDKQVVIQKRIDEVMAQEFEKMIKESSTDPLIKLLLENKLGSMTIDQIKNYLKAEKDE
jgi:hypothetical protein